jgi:uncharacterized protein (DUF1501 family)
MNRRQFLIGSSLLLPLSQAAWLSRAAEAAAGSKRLIVIFLRGAVDGLSVVVPYGDDHYYDLRRSIALKAPQQEGGVLDLDGHFGLHPALAALMPYWQSGHLAFLQACGSPDPTRSHFDAQLYMENGTPGRGAMSDGWMNRLLSLLPGPASPSRALAFGPQLPRILAGPQAVANIGLGNSAERKLPIDRPAVSDAFSKMYGGDDAMSKSFQDGMQVRNQMQADLAMDDRQQMSANEGAPLPNGFPQDAARLAKMMRQDPKIQMAFMALGGWDTHIRQGNAEGQLASRLKPLGDGLAQLAQGLGPVFKDSLIVVMSEFGRTARENGNGGTDHGHGNVMWFLGGEVAGRLVYANWPGLKEEQLYQQRDLAVTTDFRSVLGGTLTRHLTLPKDAAEHLFPGLPAGLPMTTILRA